MAADKRKRRFSTYILPILFCGLLIALAVCALCFVLWLWAGWKRRGQVAQQPPKKPQPPIPVYAYRQMGKDIHV